MQRQDIILATTNQGKFLEAKAILQPFGITLKSPERFVEVEETGSTFEENALLKAAANAKLNNIYCIAEDSGIEIDALQGRPGVRSARFAESPAESSRIERDKNNNNKVLQLLGSNSNRTGRYVCALSLANREGEFIFSTRAECELIVGIEERGINGFGYDSICSPIESPETYFSEISLEKKNQISHRKKAWEKMLEFLRSQLGEFS